MALSEGKIITIMADQAIEVLSNECPMAAQVTHYQPSASEMQRSNNTYWLEVEQETELLDGWDITGKDNGIIQPVVPCTLGEPENDFFALRADDVRDERSLRNRMTTAYKKHASSVEASIANNAARTGSLCVTAGDIVNGGWDFLADADELLVSRELQTTSGTSFYMNPTDYKKAGGDLAGKDMYGRIPEDAYTSGNLQNQIAGFNSVYRSPKLPTLKGSSATAKVNGAQSFKPQASETDVDGNPKNIDHRVAVVPMKPGHGLKDGDKISYAGVKFLSQMTKNLLTHDATFSVVAVNGNNVTIMPKPIALDDASLSREERAFANVNTTLTDDMAVTVINAKDAQTNVFWADDSITLVSQPIPANHELLSGMKVMPFSVPNVGLNGVVAFQGDIGTMAGKARTMVWYAACNKRPEASGIGISGQS